MAHELDFSKGFAAVAYRNEVPWHSYGQPWQEGWTLEQWTEHAGLDHEVERRKVFYESGDSKIAIPGMRGLVRSDNDALLSVVGKGYKVVQPREVISFFKDLIEDQGFELETAGALVGGKRVWALAKTGKNFTIPGTTDEILAYLLLATSYDKQFSTTGQWTAIRVVCNNTLEFSLEIADGANKQNHVFRVPHSQTFNEQEMKGSLGLLGDSWNKFTDDVQAMAQAPVSKKQAVEFFMEILGYEDEDAQVTLDDSYLVKKMLQSYQYAPGQKLASAKDTAWGLVNAVSHFTDHTRRAHNNGTRVNNAWFGQSAGLKRRAFSAAKELAKAA